MASLGPDISSQMRVQYRWLEGTDDLDEITQLLHRAYRPLSDAGKRFVASHQDVATTRRRIEKGETVIAVDQERIVGTITVMKPGKGGGSSHYSRGNVAACGQFAVEPEYQKKGIGSKLMQLAEERALEYGAVELALDTSEQALALIEFYARRGYRFVEHAQWDSVNYRSVVLSKILG